MVERFLPPNTCRPFATHPGTPHTGLAVCQCCGQVVRFATWGDEPCEAQTVVEPVPPKNESTLPPWQNKITILTDTVVTQPDTVTAQPDTVVDSAEQAEVARCSRCLRPRLQCKYTSAKGDPLYTPNYEVAIGHCDYAIAKKKWAAANKVGRP